MKDKPVCKYGAQCYRKNAAHLSSFQHPAGHSPGTVAAAAAAAAGGSQDRAEDGEPAAKRARGEGTTSADPVRSGSPEVTDIQPRPAAEPEDGPAEEDADDTPLLPDSPADVRDNIRQKFLVDMPEDFYSLLEFCRAENPAAPDNVLARFGLRLAGPFTLVLGSMSRPARRTARSYLTYCRYYLDPPEFQTVLCGDDSTCYHIGYYRDDPAQLPQLVLSCVNKGKDQTEPGCTFKTLGDNLFSAVSGYLTEFWSESDSAAGLRSRLLSWAERGGFSAEPRPPSVRQRERGVVFRSYQGLGVVVPYCKQTDVGYRPLGESRAQLRQLVRRIESAEDEQRRSDAMEPLSELITCVQFANDEGDPGMGLELGLALFALGGESLRSTTEFILCTAYTLIGREPFAEIVKAHLANRSREPPKL